MIDEIILDLPTSLADEVLKELINPKYLKRSHGTPSCHNAGCRGPLCRKVNRDKSRELYRKNNPAKRPRRIVETEIDLMMDTLIEELNKEKASNAVA